MDNAWPSLDLEHFGKICPDKNIDSMFKPNFMIEARHDGEFPSSCGSGIHQIWPIQAWDQFQVEGSRSWHQYWLSAPRHQGRKSL